jgi:hypothetical protein
MKNTTATTEQIVAEIAEAAKAGTLVAPASFSAFYPRAKVSAAFRMAKARGIIVVDYVGSAGTPVYKMALRLAN